ncbi:hypothetical protein AL532_26725 [Pseudomonas monteilii]|nr:hypothetical protein AL532_26725 [Pseudomonas monteilii]
MAGFGVVQGNHGSLNNQSAENGVAVGAGLPAKQAPRWMAPALPVFTGKPAPTETSHRPNQ